MTTPIARFHINTKGDEINIFSASSIIRLLTVDEHLLFNDAVVGAIQRTLDKEHLQEIYDFQQNHYKLHSSYSFTNPITLVSMKGKYAIVDGQHRFEVIKRLHANDPARFSNCYIPVVNIQIDNVDQYDSIFTMINQNKPVHLYRDINMWKSKGRMIHEYLMIHYPDYIKHSERPRFPNINPEKITQYIDKHELFQNTSWNVIIEEFESLNRFYLSHWKTHLQGIKNAFSLIRTARKKNSTHPLVITICGGYGWLHQITHKIKKDLKFEDMEHRSIHFRPQIVKETRRLVWLKRNKFVHGQCYVCDAEITLDHFTCGHIISLFDGGETTVQNLEPICSSCNRDMWVQNLHVYKTTYHRQTQKIHHQDPRPGQTIPSSKAGKTAAIDEGHGLINNSTAKELSLDAAIRRFGDRTYCEKRRKHVTL